MRNTLEYRALKTSIIAIVIITLIASATITIKNTAPRKSYPFSLSTKENNSIYTVRCDSFNMFSYSHVEIWINGTHMHLHSDSPITVQSYSRQKTYK